MEIDESETQPKNAEWAITKRCDSDPKVTVESAPQFRKHSTRSFSTVEGMQIDEITKQSPKASRPIAVSLGRGAKVTVKSDRQFKKQSCPIVLTDDGMQIDESDEQSSNPQMDERLEFGAKMTVEREQQRLKQSESNV
jgi:hypothetical protein